MRILTALAFCTLISCQQNEPVIDHTIPSVQTYTAENSPLIHNQVQAITIDRDNVKWFGTANGLSSFDGTEWKSYDTLNSALPSKYITALASDNNGNVWIGTNRGLVMYDGVDFIKCDRLKKDLINRLLVDDQKGIVWIGTDKGLCKYNGTTFERYDDPESFLLDGYVSSLALDKIGNLWMGSFDHYSFTGRLYKITGNEFIGYRLDRKGLNSCFPDALVVDSNNVVWMGVKGTMGGILVRIDGDDWKLLDRFSTGFDDFRAGINSIVIDQDKKWISTGNGLLSYDNLNWKIYNTSNSTIPDNFVFAVAIDKDGAKWIGTLAGGVMRMK